MSTLREAADRLKELRGLKLTGYELEQSQEAGR